MVLIDVRVQRPLTMIHSRESIRTIFRSKGSSVHTAGCVGRADWISRGRIEYHAVLSDASGPYDRLATTLDEPRKELKSEPIWLRGVPEELYPEGRLKRE